MKHSALMLLTLLTTLCLSGAAQAQVPPIKDEEGNEVELPKYDDKQMQCTVKCNEPAIKCMNSCGEEFKCKSKCTQTMAACTEKCGVTKKNENPRQKAKAEKAAKRARDAKAAHSH